MANSSDQTVMFKVNEDGVFEIFKLKSVEVIGKNFKEHGLNEVSGVNVSFKYEQQKID